MKTFDSELDMLYRAAVQTGDPNGTLTMSFEYFQQALKEAIEKQILPKTLDLPDIQFRSPKQELYDNGFNNAVKMARLALWGKEGEENG